MAGRLPGHFCFGALERLHAQASAYDARELIRTGSLRRLALAALVEATGWHVTSADWTDQECRALAELAESKYAHDSWNSRR